MFPLLGPALRLLIRDTCKSLMGVLVALSYPRGIPADDSTLTCEESRLGGLVGGRVVDEGDRFERAVSIAARAIPDHGLGFQLWESLTNVAWRHMDGERVGYSFRAAGDLVAAVMGSGNYLDWYCSGTAGNVAPWFRSEMAKLGWEPFEDAYPRPPEQRPGGGPLDRDWCGLPIRDDCFCARPIGHDGDCSMAP